MVMDVMVMASTLCKYDLRKGDLFVLDWARVRRVKRGSLSSELLVCGGGVRSILLLPLVARCLETIDVGSNDNSLQVVELSGPQTCKLLSTHPSKPFPRRFSGPESVCSG